MRGSKLVTATLLIVIIVLSGYQMLNPSMAQPVQLITNGGFETGGVPTQQISNGGFETGDFTGWLATGGSDNPTITTPGYSGTYAANLTATGPSGSTSQLYQPPSLTCGTSPGWILEALASFAINPSDNGTNAPSESRIYFSFEKAGPLDYAIRYVFATNVSQSIPDTNSTFDAYFLITGYDTGVWSNITRNVYTDAQSVFGSAFWAQPFCFKAVVAEVIIGSSVIGNSTQTLLLDDASLFTTEGFAGWTITSNPPYSDVRLTSSNVYAGNFSANMTSNIDNAALRQTLAMAPQYVASASLSFAFYGTSPMAMDYIQLNMTADGSPYDIIYCLQGSCVGPMPGIPPQNSTTEAVYDLRSLPLNVWNLVNRDVAVDASAVWGSGFMINHLISFTIIGAFLSTGMGPAFFFLDEVSLMEEELNVTTTVTETTTETVTNSTTITETTTNTTTLTTTQNVTTTETLTNTTTATTTETVTNSTTITQTTTETTTNSTTITQTTTATTTNTTTLTQTQTVHVTTTLTTGPLPPSGTMLSNYGIVRLDDTDNMTGHQKVSIQILCINGTGQPVPCFIVQAQVFLFNYTTGYGPLPISQDLNLQRIYLDTVPYKQINLLQSTPTPHLAPVVPIIRASGTYGEIISQLDQIAPGNEPNFVTMQGWDNHILATYGGTEIQLLAGTVPGSYVAPAHIGVAVSVVVIAPSDATVILIVTAI